MKFDGKDFARKIESELKRDLLNRNKANKKLKMVSFLVGSDPASVLYTKLKKEAAERVGIEFEVVEIGVIEKNSIVRRVSEIGLKDDVIGVMVQLPIPGLSQTEIVEIIAAIPLDKDVDGLRYPESGILPAVTRAVMSILDELARAEASLWTKKFVVVGALGSVGSSVVRELTSKNLLVIEVERDTDRSKIIEGEVVISCVGKEGIITSDMVRDGLIAIDVGSPRGDMTQQVYQKASVSIEVPGGVGPVTIVSLLKNLDNLS